MTIFLSRIESAVEKTAVEEKDSQSKQAQEANDDKKDEPTENNQQTRATSNESEQIDDFIVKLRKLSFNKR